MLRSTRKKIGALFVAIGLMFAFGACSSDADVASNNLSKEAEDFKVMRQTVFYNGITDTYILQVIGFCSVEWDEVFMVTCKMPDGKFKKHFLQKSDNVTWFSEQIDAKAVGTDRYQVNWKPKTIIPDIESR